MPRKSTIQYNPGTPPDQAPGFFRRLAAIAYDSLLLFAVLFVATAAILPFNNGQAFSRDQFYYPTYLVSVSLLFFGWFWTHGGQTPGMRAWNIKVLDFDRQPLSWKQAFIRFCTALLSWGLFGLGFIWISFNRNKRAWHDSLSKTALYFDRPLTQAADTVDRPAKNQSARQKSNQHRI
ncbi:MAG: RDD family protein [Gammaproteobacteria bacterium]